MKRMFMNVKGMLFSISIVYPFYILYGNSIVGIM